MFTAAQTALMIRATGGIAVVVGASSTWGHYDVSDAGVFDSAEVLAAEPHVTVPTGVLTGLEIGAAITVDGTAYTVRDHRRIEDGGLTRIWLAE